MDTLSKKQRSWNMSRIRRKNTSPEIRFRRFLSIRGVRGYRLDATILGRPDLYFPRLKLAVFIDGCFWHRCPACFIRPKTNRSFWTPKIRKNVARDRKVTRMLQKQGFVVLRFWEHETEADLDRCYNKFIRLYGRNTDQIQKKSLRRERKI